MFLFCISTPPSVIPFYIPTLLHFSTPLPLPVCVPTPLVCLHPLIFVCYSFISPLLRNSFSISPHVSLLLSISFPFISPPLYLHPLLFPLIFLLSPYSPCVCVSPFLYVFLYSPYISLLCIFPPPRMCPVCPHSPCIFLLRMSSLFIYAHFPHSILIPPYIFVLFSSPPHFFIPSTSFYSTPVFVTSCGTCCFVYPPVS